MKLTFVYLFKPDIGDYGMQDSSINKNNARPFLKWAGGKKQVVSFIMNNLPQDIKDSKKIENYFEPFLGGGAVFFNLIKKYEMTNVYLSDINPELILTFNVIKKRPDQLISKLKCYSEEFLPLNLDSRKEYYYHVRDDFNENLKGFNYNKVSKKQVLRAAQMIFLNKTCFNGLYRVNKSGKFNVPIGSYKNPSICDEINILDVHDVLETVKIYCSDYSDTENFIDENSFLYLDPPYLPIKKESFTSYSAEGFGLKEQLELSQFCKRIDGMGAHFILSNSVTPDKFLEETYRNLNLKTFKNQKIEVKRFINSDAKKRGAIKELLIYNY